MAALIPRLDLFISLIGALASSCLAIIFPAIIETCTFWHQDVGRHSPNEEDEQSDDADDGEDGEEERRSRSAADCRQRARSPAEHNGRGGSPARRRRRRKLLSKRSLFLVKNLLLILFGLLGLLTGGWQSLSQLFASDLTAAQEPRIK